MNFFIKYFWWWYPLTCSMHQKLFKLLFCLWISTQYFNCLVVVVITWHQLFGSQEQSVIFFLLQIVYEGFAEILCDVFCVPFLHPSIILQVLLFKNKFLFIHRNQTFVSFFVERITVIWAITWFSWMWRVFI